MGGQVRPAPAALPGGDPPREHVDRGVVGRPPSTTRGAARRAASKPDAALARAMGPGVCLRPAAPVRSMPSTSPSGMSRLMVGSPDARGLATIAGTSDGGLRAAGPAPQARGSAAALRPRSATISTESGRIPTSGSLPRHAGPATHSRPSTSTQPRLSALARTHLTASNAAPGSARISARSSRRASADGRPSRHPAAPLGRAQPSASRESGSASDPTLGAGASGLRLRWPAALAAEPLSLPE